MMLGGPSATIAHRVFLAILVLKFLLGAAQILSGAALALAPPDALSGLVHGLTRLELAEDPSDPLARALLALVPVATTERSFYVGYLLLHGLLNAGVAVALHLGHRRAYSISIAVLLAFVAYQLWKYTGSPDILLLALTAIDVAVIVLSVIEMRSDARRPEAPT